MGTLNPTVLLVEDDRDLRYVFEHVLIFAGYHVLTAAHGGEALQILNRETPAIVVLDLQLPWVSGLELLATMRDVSRLRPVPVLVVTGTAMTAQDLRRYQPLRLLRKPLDVDALTSAVQELLAVDGS